MWANIIDIQVQLTLNGKRVHERLSLSDPKDVGYDRICSGKSAGAWPSVGTRSQIGRCDSNCISTTTCTCKQVFEWNNVWCDVN